MSHRGDDLTSGRRAQRGVGRPLRSLHRRRTVATVAICAHRSRLRRRGVVAPGEHRRPAHRIPPAASSSPTTSTRTPRRATTGCAPARCAAAAPRRNPVHHSTVPRHFGSGAQCVRPGGPSLLGSIVARRPPRGGGGAGSAERWLRRMRCRSDQVAVPAAAIAVGPAGHRTSIAAWRRCHSNARG